MIEALTPSLPLGWCRRSPVKRDFRCIQHATYRSYREQYFYG